MDPVGTQPELFALMLHDRLVDVELRLASLAPRQIDERIEVVGCAPGSEATYVRVHSASQIDQQAWGKRVAKELGAFWGEAVDVTAVQHFSTLHDHFVLEALAVCRPRAAADPQRRVVQVGNAALDASAALGELAAPKPVWVCGVKDRCWFVDSFCAASGPDGGRIWSYDPDDASVTESEADPWIPDDGWCMMQGWLAHNREQVEVLHPRALSADTEARRLWAFVTRLA